MYFRTLTVLMWRHGLARRREFISTMMEFAFPLLPFFILYIFKEQLLPEMPTPYADVTKYIGVETPKIKSINEILGPPCVLYTPETNFTSALMNLVGQKLNLRLLKALRGRRAHGYFPFKNALSVFKYTANMRPNEAVVVFHNVTLIGWPDSLSYSIRMKTDFHTDLETFVTREDDEDDQVLISHDEYGKVYEAFMKLQWAIDTSYIQMLAGENVNQTMKLQEFPHLRYATRRTSYAIKADLLFLAANVAVLPAFYMFMLRKILEKASGTQELMKMMGVTSWTLALSHGLNAFLPGLTYVMSATILMKLHPNPLLEKSSSFLISLALCLHLIFAITAALVCSYLARKAPPTALTVSSVYILLALPSYTLNGLGVTNYMVYPSGLVPFMPLAWIMKEAAKLEYLGPGLNFKTMMTSHYKSSGSAFLAYMYFIVQIALCLILFWYFDHVIPGIYGSTYPWYFIFKKDYWVKKPPVPISKTEPMGYPAENSQYFETPPQHLEATIRVINVTKEYDLHRALDNLSLDVFKEEITILLGHNGAGKSTLMSVITGMTGVTKGTVLINGMDIASDKTLVRQHIGFCPQENMLFDYNTVLEHVMFYTLLDGGTFREARKSSKVLLEKLHLRDKAHNYTYELSGGMKRRVQLACALAGQASVLLLDEPTSGLDVETRRALWDLLISLRGSHTMLLTTHFMEEADALGDRVAALHAGKLRCHATPMYLKRAIGSGYRLSFTTTGVPNEPAITSFIKSVVPGASVKQTSFNTISYNLPASDTKQFPALFHQLESRRQELGVDSIGVGTSTLEDVFLQLCSNVETGPITEDELQERKAPAYVKLKGLPLFTSQMLALLKRYLRFLWIYKVTQIGLGVIRVVILILVITAITNDAKDEPEPDRTLLAMNLDMYRPSPDFRVLYKVNGSDSELRPLSDQYPKVHFVKAADVVEAALRVGQTDKLEYNNYLAGIELNNTDAKVLYTTTIRHAAPVALNLMSNLLAKRLLPWAGGRTITTYNHPLVVAYTNYISTDVKEPKSMTNIKLWMFSTTTMLLSGIIFMVQLPCKEASGARHLHILAGCSPEMHWLTMLLAAVLQVLLTYVVTLAIACTYLDHNHTFSDKDFIFAASVSVLGGTTAMLSFSYLMTFHFTQSAAVAIIAITMVFFVLVFPILLAVMPSMQRIKPYVLVAMPPYTFNEAMMGCSMTAYLNTLCKLNRKKCPALAFPIPHFSAEECCQTTSNSNPWCYFCFQDPAPGKKIVFMAVQTFVYMIMVILTQRGFFCLMWEKMMNFKYKKPTLLCNDDSVTDELMYVEQTVKLPSNKIPDLMLVSDVHKNYNGLCSRFNAVKGVSFSVKKGECFGLLGVNGAGKSTMFQMLTAELCPTRGRIIANGREMTVPYTTDYLYTLGYCPQFWVLDDFLTGRQNLDLLLKLNGLNARDAETETKTWIKLVGLENYTDRLVSGYSGGCLRRMAAASALCTNAPVTLLDEPTAGVDVAARRRVWYALKRGLRDHHAIIITSHSLDEMEALCHRISIMSAGEICALGTPAALRAAFATGHSLILKIKYEPTLQQRLGFAGASDPKVDKLKAAIENKFKCTLKDEHKTMLHYHINEVMHYSTIFEEMEDLLATYPELIEDYSVSETTLEEVFLSFAKPKTEDKPKKKEKREVAAGPT